MADLQPGVTVMSTSSSSPVYVVASGDLRSSANQVCWPAQEAFENALTHAIQAFGYEVIRAHPYDSAKGHGFIDSQRYGMKVFADIPKDAPLIVAEAVWQYTHHVLAGLIHHQGPILTVANWSGQWPGLVGLLNLNASLRKAGKDFDTLWSVDFKDRFFLDGLNAWLKGERIRHDRSHVRPMPKLAAEAEKLGKDLADKLRRDKAILGVFDEGCM